MLLNKEAKFVMIEKKTGKRREVKINREFQKHIKDCYQALHIEDMDEPCFLSTKGKPYSVQWINLVFKELKDLYNLKIEPLFLNSFANRTIRQSFFLQSRFIMYRLKISLCLLLILKATAIIISME